MSDKGQIPPGGFERRKPGYRGSWQAIRNESVGLGVAEFASGFTSLGVVALADDIAPNFIKSTTKAISKVCIEPFIETIENGLSKVCKLEECQPDKTKPKEERAEKLTHSLVVFSAAWAASMAVKLGTRKGWNRFVEGQAPLPSTGSFVKDFYLNYLKPSKHDAKVIAWDEAVHIGSLVLLNTGMAKSADDMIRGASDVLQKKMGWSKKRSDDVASMGVIWELPNALGWLAGVGAIVHSHTKGRT